MRAQDGNYNVLNGDTERDTRRERKSVFVRVFRRRIVYVLQYPNASLGGLLVSCKPQTSQNSRNGVTVSAGSWEDEV